jgi:sugar lactone lactonase YvrE
MPVTRIATAALTAILLAGTARAAEIAYPAPRIFPESITATARGELITGSGDGTIWRARPGDAQTKAWLSPAQTGGGTMLGVYADDKAKTLWTCFLAGPTRSTEVRAFDLASGAPRGVYPLGKDEVCNDFAVARDGTLYISETRKGIVYRLRKGGTALENWFTDPRLAALDGIALDSDGTLYLTTVATSHAFRMTFGKGGTPGTLTELTLSRPMDRGDGLRALGKGRFLIAEGGPAGGVAIATVKGDALDLAMIPGSKPGATSAVKVGGDIWMVVPKLAFMRSPDQDPGPYAIYSVSER